MCCYRLILCLTLTLPHQQLEGRQYDKLQEALEKAHVYKQTAKMCS